VVLVAHSVRSCGPYVAVLPPAPGPFQSHPQEVAIGLAHGGRSPTDSSRSSLRAPEDDGVRDAEGVAVRDVGFGE
jgi:hypothetical protein